MRRAALALAAVLAVATAGCGSPAPSPSISASTPTPAATPAPADSVDASPFPISPIPSTSGSAGAVVEDPSLLDLLPADVDGVPIALEHQSFLEAAQDAAFGQNVRRAAFAIGVDGSDLVSGVVAELVPGTFSDAFFRDWRDTYNAGACGQAGGVAGNAEAQLGGRTVYIATCAGGLRVYHAWLEERGTIVSAFSLGDRQLGEALMGGLQP